MSCPALERLAEILRVAETHLVGNLIQGQSYIAQQRQGSVFAKVIQYGLIGRVTLGKAAAQGPLAHAQL